MANGWGGRRVGAGRTRRTGLRRVAHRTRGRIDALMPVHVTVRVVEGVISLRTMVAARALKAAFIAGRERGSFRLVHFSVMTNHLHLIVEAGSANALSLGMQGLLVRIARGLNRAVNRTGRVFVDRFHARVVGSTLDVRNTIAYVLGNARRHGIAFGGRLDPYSSAAWFGGWRDVRASTRDSPVAAAQCWQLRGGWFPHGRLDALMVTRARRACDLRG